MRKEVATVGLHEEDGLVWSVTPDTQRFTRVAAASLAIARRTLWVWPDKVRVVLASVPQIQAVYVRLLSVVTTLRRVGFYDTGVLDDSRITAWSWTIFAPTVPP